MQEELSMEDLLELEALEIRGGRDGSGGTIGQDKCMRIRTNPTVRMLKQCGGLQ